MAEESRSKPWVVMRSHNDMPRIAETLAMVRRQSRPCELLVFDNASEDGTADETRKYTDRVENVPAGEYVPGRVLNQAMEMSDGEVVAFLNSDCTPCDERWLENLLSGFRDERTAAVFGRQMPRPDCKPLFARDTEAAYGDGRQQKRWRHCFSMASAAIRRSVWERRRFSEDLQYSEDIEWTWNARRMGFEVRYVADAAALHSHNYTLRQFYRRHHGEGRAEAAFLEWTPWQASLLRYSLLPYARQVLGDLRYCASHGSIGAALYSPVLRFAQLLGRRAGFRAGLREGGKRP